MIRWMFKPFEAPLEALLGLLEAITGALERLTEALEGASITDRKAVDLGDRLAALEAGQAKWQGSAEALMERAEARYASAHSEANRAQRLRQLQEEDEGADEEEIEEIVTRRIDELLVARMRMHGEEEEIPVGDGEGIEPVELDGPVPDLDDAESAFEALNTFV